MIELMVVMAMLAILVMLTLPTYQSIVKKIQRTEGQALLLEVQAHLEKYYFTHHHYPKGLSELTRYQQDQVATDNAYYQVSLDTPSSACPAAYCYRLVAEHVSRQRKDTLALYSNGQREGPW